MDIEKSGSAFDRLSPTEKQPIIAKARDKKMANQSFKLTISFECAKDIGGAYHVIGGDSITDIGTNHQICKMIEYALYQQSKIEGP